MHSMLDFQSNFRFFFRVRAIEICAVLFISLDSTDSELRCEIESLPDERVTVPLPHLSTVVFCAWLVSLASKDNIWIIFVTSTLLWF